MSVILVKNIEIDLSPIVQRNIHYDQYLFFLPNGIFSLVTEAVKRFIKLYDNNTISEDFIVSLTRDIELYQEKCLAQYEKLYNPDFLDYVEDIAIQVELETYNYIQQYIFLDQVESIPVYRINNNILTLDARFGM